MPKLHPIAETAARERNMQRLRLLAITCLMLLGLAVAGQRSLAADDTIKIGY
jgi:hypothetical protein